jgi:heme-degrading monooxygenase HmoA
MDAADVPNDRGHAPRMMAMIFEFWFDPAASDIYEDYLRASALVRIELAAVEGFEGVESFRSTADPLKFVAIGFFTDEAAVTRWRNNLTHRRVQNLGRDRYFVRYRLRMAEVVRDYSGDDRAQAPLDSQRWRAATTEES